MTNKYQIKYYQQYTVHYLLYFCKTTLSSVSICLVKNKGSTNIKEILTTKNKCKLKFFKNVF